MQQQVSTIRRFVKLLGGALTHWQGWLTILAVTLLSSALTVIQPWPMQVLVDHVLVSGSEPSGMRHLPWYLPSAASQYGLLIWVVAAGVALFGLSTAIDFVLTRTWIRIGQKMVYDLSADLLAHVQGLSLLFHRRHHVGDLMSRITGDSYCVYKVVDTLVFTPIYAAATLVFMIVLMVRMDVGLTVISVAVVPLMAGSWMLLGAPLRAVARRRREIDGQIQSHVHQTLTGMAVVQAFNQEERERLRFEQHAAEAIRAHGRNVFLNSIGGLFSGMLPTLGTAAVLWVGAQRVLGGGISIGELLVFLAYLRTMQLSSTKLTGLYAALQEIRISSDRVYELLEENHHVKEVPNAFHLPRVRGGLIFEKVTFGYEADRAVLREFSLEIPAGQTLAIVGGTGAGKSTLASLVPRLFDPWSGRVLLDGHDLRDVTLSSLRRQVSLVLQEPFLFPLSVAENIAYGRIDATSRQIEEAAQAAGADHDFICRLPDGYQTVIGERGATLSGGERQRLSIARALLRDAPVLILDEPTSALDATTESQILEALRHLMAGRTTLMIAHRLSTVRDADRIIVLEHGQLAESGTHEQLLARKGIYAGLCRMQMGEATEAVATAG